MDRPGHRSKGERITERDRVRGDDFGGKLSGEGRRVKVVEDRDDKETGKAARGSTYGIRTDRGCQESRHRDKCKYVKIILRKKALFDFDAYARARHYISPTDRFIKQEKVFHARRE